MTGWLIDRIQIIKDAGLIGLDRPRPAPGLKGIAQWFRSAVVVDIGAAAPLPRVVSEADRYASAGGDGLPPMVAELIEFEVGQVFYFGFH